MCGISGFWIRGGGKKALLEEGIANMAEALSHRGPDDTGAWVEEKSGVALGHKRLSILDLSQRGHQPMISYCGRYIIVYNGEVYNFRELRARLENEGVNFKSECDTEVVISALSKWGIAEALKHFNGMFAFALWDRKEQKLYLARDRIGIKPLYYSVQNGILFFASELKAMRAHESFRPEIDREALALFFRYNYIPTPYSIYRHTQKLKQGHYLAVDNTFHLRQFCYWDAEEMVREGAERPYKKSDKEAVEETECLLFDAVTKRMVSDVPLGVFLSGGVDSSTIAALMQKRSAAPVRTFTVGFHETGYNEAPYAKEIAGHLGTNHTELYVTPEEAIESIPKLPEIYDEPFSDMSQIPTFLISKLTRRFVTVSLSGDGGDETFGGYNRYIWTHRIWYGTVLLPYSAKLGISRLIKNISPESWNDISRALGALAPGIFKQRLFGEKMYKLADVMTSRSLDECYINLASHWKKPAELVLCSREPITLPQNNRMRHDIKSFLEKMMFLDLMTYLPDDILTKVDRASMAVGLEARVPLLDHRIIQFSKRLPLSYKMRNRTDRWVLRQVLYKHIPRRLIDRPKMGFILPLDGWLRRPLRDWAEEHLNEKRIRADGILNPAPIRKIWNEHLSGKRNWHTYIWDVLMFQAWKERWM